MADERVQRFVNLHRETEELLTQEKVKEAKQRYLDVVNAYHEIQNSNLERFHKDLAYDHVTTLFKKVNTAKARVKVPYNLIAAAVLVIAFSFLVVFKPSVVGLAGFEDVVRQPLEITVKNSGVERVTLKDRPLSISLSGSYEGTAKVLQKL